MFYCPNTTHTPNCPNYRSPNPSRDPLPLPGVTQQKYSTTNIRPTHPAFNTHRGSTMTPLTDGAGINSTIKSKHETHSDKTYQTIATSSHTPKHHHHLQWLPPLKKSTLPNPTNSTVPKNMPVVSFLAAKCISV
ncbi:hypothetical protein M0805_009661 [Coniferiporia weirii]|nr:hypothetical protein M0805_009661 [Coniferiporia weirii]